MIRALATKRFNRSLTARPDDQLIAAVLAGDTADFAELAARYRDRVERLCQRFFADREMVRFAGITLAYRYKLLRVPGGNMVERIRALKLNRSLRLSPSQREEIVEVMEEVMQLRRSMQRERRRLMIGAYLKVRANLNPEQQKKFDREFVPPKFRDEARQAEQHRRDDATEASP